MHKITEKVYGIQKIFARMKKIGINIFPTESFEDHLKMSINLNLKIITFMKKHGKTCFKHFARGSCSWTSSIGNPTHKTGSLKQNEDMNAKEERKGDATPILARLHKRNGIELK